MIKVTGEISIVAPRWETDPIRDPLKFIGTTFCNIAVHDDSGELQYSHVRTLNWPHGVNSPITSVDGSATFGTDATFLITEGIFHGTNVREARSRQIGGPDIVTISDLMLDTEMSDARLTLLNTYIGLNRHLITSDVANAIVQALSSIIGESDKKIENEVDPLLAIMAESERLRKLERLYRAHIPMTLRLLLDKTQFGGISELLTPTPGINDA